MIQNIYKKTFFIILTLLCTLQNTLIYANDEEQEAEGIAQITFGATTMGIGVITEYCGACLYIWGKKMGKKTNDCCGINQSIIMKASSGFAAGFGCFLIVGGALLTAAGVQNYNESMQESDG